jgi:hypothetical protein
MSLQNFTFTPKQTMLLHTILVENINEYQRLYDDLCNDENSTTNDISDVLDELMSLKTMYSQVSKKV